MCLFPEVRYFNEFSRPRIRPATPEFGSKRTPHLRSTVPNVQRHMAYFAVNKSERALFLLLPPSISI
jgi:hypothetical protein